MKGNRFWRWSLLSAILIVLSIVLSLCIQRENKVCMGVPILSNDAYKNIGENVREDLSSFLFHNDQLAAVDTSESIVYISQNITRETQLANLNGLLSIERTGYSLAFAPDKAFSDLYSAVSSGHRFQLIVFTPHDSIVRYDIIFTTLPLLRMEGSAIGTDEEGRELLEGDMCLWSPMDPDTEKYSCKTSRVQWNSRGHSTSHFPKKSQKLTLKDKQGNNRDVSLIGMGADDDWILNAMFVDNVKLREMLTTTLWNELAEISGDHKMSSAEYVEVVCNGEYNGMYLLQRRLDDKYLQLDENQVLVRGESRYAASEEQLVNAENFLEKIHAKADYSNIVQTNWVDVNFFVEFLQAIDNTGYNYFYNNIAYVVTFEDGSASVRYLLWDTDMTYGLWLVDGEFIYVKSYAIGAFHDGAHRVERSVMCSVYPEIVSYQSGRWRELRSGIMSEEHIFSLIDQIYAEIKNSGALERDIQRWGLHHEEDTLEDLKEYIESRLAVMDSQYFH